MWKDGVRTKDESLLQQTSPLELLDPRCIIYALGFNVQRSEARPTEVQTRTRQSKAESPATLPRKKGGQGKALLYLNTSKVLGVGQGSDSDSRVGATKVNKCVTSIWVMFASDLNRKLNFNFGLGTLASEH